MQGTLHGTILHNRRHRGIFRKKLIGSIAYWSVMLKIYTSNPPDHYLLGHSAEIFSMAYESGVLSFH